MLKTSKLLLQRSMRTWKRKP